MTHMFDNLFFIFSVEWKSPGGTAATLLKIQYMCFRFLFKMQEEIKTNFSKNSCYYRAFENIGV